MPPLLVNTDFFALRVHFILIGSLYNRIAYISDYMYHIGRGCIQESLGSQSPGTTSDLGNIVLKVAAP